MMFYALVGLYSLSVVSLTFTPSNEQAWAVYLQLAPTMRQPFSLMQQYIMVNSVQIFLLSIMLVIIGFVALDRRRRVLRFFYFHIAMLLLLASLVSQGAFSGFRPFARHSYVALLNSHTLSVILLLAALLACLAWHVQSLVRLRRFATPKGEA